MTLANPTYAVGYGKPPVHTRFRKGQSGNPTGKAGPAKLLKARFHRALVEALENEMVDVALSEPQSVIAAIAKQLTLDAVAGRPAAQRLLLSLLDAGIDDTAKSRHMNTAEGHAEEEPDEGEIVELPQDRNEAQPFSLLQGKKQGSAKKTVEPIWDILEAEEAAREAQSSRQTDERKCGERGERGAGYADGGAGGAMNYNLATA